MRAGYVLYRALVIYHVLDCKIVGLMRTRSRFPPKRQTKACSMRYRQWRGKQQPWAWGEVITAQFANHAQIEVRYLSVQCVRLHEVVCTSISMGQKKLAAKYLEAAVLLLIIAAIWLVMFLPVTVYFLVSGYIKTTCSRKFSRHVYDRG